MLRVPSVPLDAISEETHYESLHKLEGLNIPANRSDHPLNMKISGSARTLEKDPHAGEKWPTWCFHALIFVPTEKNNNR